jgi:uncharacterized membrane protein (UPF0136 family)
MALLYSIYPGFLSQLNGIDYQSQIISLAAAIWSLGLTAHTFFEKRLVHKVVAIVLAVRLGIIYVGLVEYEVGFELMRLFVLFLLAGRVMHDYRQRILATLKLWLPYSSILLVFGIWRLFFFESERGATDINVQFEQLRLYPLQTGYRWMLQVIQDLFDVLFSAWVIPLSQLTSYIQRWGGLLAIVTTGLALLMILKSKQASSQDGSSPFNLKKEALALGLLVAIGGLIPIAMVNREVAFPAFSRYSLVSSVGVAIFVTAALMHLKRDILSNLFIAGLCLASILTHHANSVKYAQETAATNLFWWQVSWRVSQFEKNTTLIANYPAVIIEEDYFIWGPASLIYYPEKQNPKNIQPGIYAAVLNAETIAKVRSQERQEYDKRKNIITYKNYRNVVILTQPASNACVHIINGQAPEYSSSEWDFIREVGAYSKIERVLVNETLRTPPAIVFGSEPPHGWCYYYQKANLARQMGDWDQVLEIGDQAFAQGYSPADLIEWMPFLQAYAHAGNIERLTDLAATVNNDLYIALQACHILGSMPELSPDVLQTVDLLYCPE